MLYLPAVSVFPGILQALMSKECVIPEKRLIWPINYTQMTLHIHQKLLISFHWFPPLFSIANNSICMNARFSLSFTAVMTLERRVNDVTHWWRHITQMLFLGPNLKPNSQWPCVPSFITLRYKMKKIWDHYHYLLTDPRTCTVIESTKSKVSCFYHLSHTGPK